MDKPESDADANHRYDSLNYAEYTKLLLDDPSSHAFCERFKVLHRNRAEGRVECMVTLAVILEDLTTAHTDYIRTRIWGDICSSGLPQTLLRILCEEELYAEENISSVRTHLTWYSVSMMTSSRGIFV